MGRRIFTAVAAVLAMLAATPGVGAAETEHPEARLYDAERGAFADVGLALARALISRNNVLLVMGANWCHDSRGLAGWFETPRFQAMIEQRYELVYVDVGHPQEGEGRNIDIARRFGIEDISGTPTVLILSPEGALLNADTATGWNNAASRTEDEIFDYFAGF